MSRQNAKMRLLGPFQIVTYGGAAQFPANLPYFLAIAASNQFDEAKTSTSADSETFWASSRGPEIR